MSDEKPMGQVIQIDEARIRDHLGEMVRGTVEETLNAMLDAEADQLCGAGRYERSEARQDTRAGSYERTLQTSAGEVNLKVPKLRRQTFETAIIERYRRRESSVEESLIEAACRVCRLVARQPVHTLGHEPRLPAPHHRLGLAGSPHDLGRAATICCRNDYFGSPNMLLRRVAIANNRLKPMAICRRDVDDNSCSHNESLNCFERLIWESPE